MPESAPPIDPKKLKPIMYWAGLTLHACQQLDYGLKLVLFMTVEAGLSRLDRERASAIIEEERRLTTGQVLGLLLEHVTLSPGWKATIEKAVQQRNRFVHGYLAEAAVSVCEGRTTREILDEIKSIRAIILAGDQAVQEILDVLYKQLGLSFKSILERVQSEVRDLQARDPE